MKTEYVYFTKGCIVNVDTGEVYDVMQCDMEIERTNIVYIDDANRYTVYRLFIY